MAASLRNIAARSLNMGYPCLRLLSADHATSSLDKLIACTEWKDAYPEIRSWLEVVSKPPLGLNFCVGSRRSTAGIHLVFRGLNTSARLDLKPD